MKDPEGTEDHYSEALVNRPVSQQAGGRARGHWSGGGEVLGKTLRGEVRA